MLEANVEMLRAAYKGFNVNKQFDLDLLAPDVEFTQPEIGESVYHGPEGVSRGVQELLDVFDDIRAEPEEFFVRARRSWCSCGSAVVPESAACRSSFPSLTCSGSEASRWPAGT